MRQQTWLAIVVCILGVIPGMIVGGIASYLYRMMVGWQSGYDQDFLMLRTLFGIEWPSQIIQWIFFVGFPAGVHGTVAGAIATFIAGAVCKGANVETAVYATGTLVTGLFVVFLVLTVIAGTVPNSTVEAIVQIIGLWIGLISTASSMPKPAATAKRT